jgi:glycine cleavage system H protein
MNPTDRYYSSEHEWALLNHDETVSIGITEYAKDELGDLVFLELPALGTSLQKMQKLGEVESVKSVSDLFSPISGEVVEINQNAIDNPEIINEDPYGEGWLLILKPSNSKELEDLMPASEYESFLEHLEH